MTWQVFQRNAMAPDALDLSGIAILFVEDLHELRDSVAGQLRDCGATVLEAASCGEALELTLAGAEFQILLASQELDDELSGTDLAAHICDRRPGVRVLLLSRRIDGVLLGRMRPGWQVLSKRVKQAELAVAIGRLVAQ